MAFTAPRTRPVEVRVKCYRDFRASSEERCGVVGTRTVSDLLQSRVGVVENLCGIQAMCKQSGLNPDGATS
jgi:hypothetical protein